MNVVIFLLLNGFSVLMLLLVKTLYYKKHIKISWLLGFASFVTIFYTTEKVMVEIGFVFLKATMIISCIVLGFLLNKTYMDEIRKESVRRNNPVLYQTEEGKS